MTGIERLRELARRRGTLVVPPVHGMYGAGYVAATEDMSERLSDIADQIERETQPKGDPSADTTVDAYDLLPQEDRDAIAWVKEHGGLEKVKKLLDWVVGHCSTEQQLDFDFWLSGRVMYELGFYEDMADRDEVERRLTARLMPEGLSWPVFEDGDPVRIGEYWGEDDFDTSVTRIDTIEFAADGIRLGNEYTEAFYRPGERVKRPAPKVLDADGAEIREGRIAYGTRGRKYRITALCEYEPSIVHAQALDDAEMGDEFIAANVELNSYQLDASKLTHERPEIDSWERLEEDADATAHLFDAFDEDASARIRDLVRRARALAGVSE